MVQRESIEEIAKASEAQRTKPSEEQRYVVTIKSSDGETKKEQKPGFRFWFKASYHDPNKW